MFALVLYTRQPGAPRNLLPDTQIGAGRGSWRSHLDCRGAAKCGPDASSAHANVKLHDPPVYPEGDVLPALDTKQTCGSVTGMSASLIGHSGSSAFRLSTTTVSMSLTGSCFSSESAPGALPSWDSRTRRNDLSGGLAVRRTVGPSGHANSPHPSSREGHHSTARWRLECPYGIRCCTVFMLLLLWPVLGSSGTRCRQPICGA